MAGESTSPNMNLVLPGVGVTAGPQYATDLNSSLTTIDGHNHTSGSGVAIPPDGLNINADLTFQNHNAIALRSLRFQVQSAVLAGVSDLGCLYEVGVDLYYNDGAGNQVRLTQSGAVSGTPGSISNLVSPASASYNAGSTTFVFQSDANTAANIDGGSFLLRNSTASSNAVTLSAPSSLASNYTVVLPTLPGSQKIMTLDASGNMAAPYTVDNSTLAITTNVIAIKAGGITATEMGALSVATAALQASAVTTAKINDGAVTPAKKASLGEQLSSSSGSFSVPVTGTPQAVTNLSVSITTTGRPVFIGLISDGGGSFVTVGANNGAIIFERDGGGIANYLMQTSIILPSSSFYTVDTTATAGTHTYAVFAQLSAGSMTVSGCKLIAYEL